MAQVELIMPKMGESIMEATILNWVKKEGDQVAMDETVLEIATDKVDSEIPSPVQGQLVKILFHENAVVSVGTTIALIETGEAETREVPFVSTPATIEKSASASVPKQTEPTLPATVDQDVSTHFGPGQSDRFYSPLVRNIAAKEHLSPAELDRIPGSGLGGRVTKEDILTYLAHRQNPLTPQAPQQKEPISSPVSPTPIAPKISREGNIEIVEMDRMRRLIAEHMVMSKHVSAHVTSFIEVDVTNLVRWREQIKTVFDEKYGEKITFTPIFLEAVIKAIHEFPLINSSVDGDKIILRKDIHIGMATALPTGNLIVPVIRHADMLNLVGLTKSVNDLANRARRNALKPDEIQGATFTMTNVGSFGSVMGTPIINQPQVAILAIGAIRKKPAVLETEYGDTIAIRHMMFMSLSYDHRIIDGFVGGSFLKRVADNLEGFDTHRQL